MGKVAGTATMATLGSAATAGAVFLSRANNLDYVLPDKMEEFESGDKLEGCVQSLFPNLKQMKVDSSSEENGTTIDSNFFGSGDKKATEACLVINWNKNTFSNDKWKGKYKFLWAVKNEASKKDFVVFAIADSQKAKKFKWIGNAYSLENKDKWEVSKKIEIKEGSTTSKEVEAKDKFPYPKITEVKYWDFLNSDEDKQCSDNECTDTPKTTDTFEGYWTWQGGEGNSDKAMGEWTSNLCKWWKETFKEDKWKMEEVVKELKGQWIERVWNGIDKSEDKK